MNNENLPIIDVSWGLCGYIYNGMKKKKIGDHSLLGRKKKISRSNLGSTLQIRETSLN